MLEPADDCDAATYHAAKADTLRESGKRFASQVVEDNVGAYTVDDWAHEYFYLVRWEGKPVEAPRTEVSGEKFAVMKGDWYCEGE